MVVHTCDTGTQEARAGGSCNFEASLNYKGRHGLIKQKQTKKVVLGIEHMPRMHKAWVQALAM